MRILIPVLVGSLIGYLTNWLAIKMLFRPHYEKKLFGVSLPFTPGLIPKERSRMSKNIGEAVGTHLLSSETIIQAISSSENEEKIKDYLNKNIIKLRQNDIKIEDYLKNTIGEEFLDLKFNLKLSLSNFIIRFIRREKTKNYFKTLVKEKIDSFDVTALYENIDIKLNKALNLLGDSEKLRREVELLLDKTISDSLNNNMTLEELIPNDIYLMLDKYLDDHTDEIGDNVRDILKDDEVKMKIKSSISNLVMDRSNKLLMAFIGPDVISEKIFESLEKYIEKRETNRDIIDIIKFIIEKVKAKTVSSIASSATKIVDKKSLELVADKTIRYALSTENIEKIKKEAIDFLRQNENEGRENVNKYLNTAFEKIVYSLEIEDKIKDITSSIIDNIGDKTISEVFNKFSDEKLTSIYNISKNIFSRFAESKLPEIISMLNVSKIVEDKINSFEIDYTEKLILDIARKELNQITRLGALLGGILGLLSPLLQFIY